MSSNRILPVENFPFDQFKLLGIDKDAVKKLPQTELKALQSGSRTSLIQFNNFKVGENAHPITLNAKLSITTDADGKPKLKIHPVNLEANNYLGLSEKEIAHIKKDPLNVIPKMVLDKKGELIDSFVSLDTTTNEYIAVKRESIKAPEAINDITLTEQQKNDYKNGKPIQIGKDNYRLDVNSETGLAGKNLINLEFKSGKYNVKNAMLDFVLIASGLAPIVLIEHLAKLIARNVIGNVIDNKKTINELLNADLKKPIANAMKEIAEKAKNGVVVSDTEKNKILIFNVEEALKQNQVTSVNLQPVQNEIKLDELKPSNIDVNSKPGQEEIHSINQKEKIGEELNGLQESFDSKGYFNNDEKAKNQSLTNEFNAIGKKDKISSNDQTIDFLGQENNQDKKETTNLNYAKESGLLKEYQSRGYIVKNKELLDNPTILNIDKDDAKDIIKYLKFADGKGRDFAVINSNDNIITSYHNIDLAREAVNNEGGTIVKTKDLINTFSKQPDGGDYIITSSTNELKEKTNLSSAIKM